MNSKTKFRAWDKKRKIMIVNALEIADVGLGEGSVLINEEAQTGNELIWMQFTGVKDKNGKEIFEGDILREGGLRMEVIFLDACFQLRVLWNRNLIPIKSFEVIGNIYENQELIVERETQ